jgi:hypothetical protein
MANTSQRVKKLPRTEIGTFSRMSARSDPLARHSQCHGIVMKNAAQVLF